MTVTDRMITAPEETLALPAAPAVVRRPLGVFTRPQGSAGWHSRLFTVAHNRIGILYAAAALFFFLFAASAAIESDPLADVGRVRCRYETGRGRRGGRPKAMDERTLRLAEAMLRDTGNYPFVGDVIDRLEIGRTAFYRYFPPERIRQLRAEHPESART